MAILTHRLYSKNGNKKIYFCGSIVDTIEDGETYTDVIWDWTEDINRAELLYTPDAWSLLREAYKLFPRCIMEVERIVTLEEVLSHFS